MLKAGLVMGVVMMFVAAALGFVNPLAVPCIAPLAGALAGYWAAAAERAPTASLASRVGSGAGALAGLGALLGHLFAGIATASGLGPRGAAALIQQFGFNVDISSPVAYYSTALTLACCTGLISVALMAGVGGAAGMLRHRTAGPAGT
jgi:hypothetical protein